jgi:hypothetical protein
MFTHPTFLSLYAEACRQSDLNPRRHARAARFTFNFFRRRPVAVPPPVPSTVAIPRIQP